MEIRQGGHDDAHRDRGQTALVFWLLLSVKVLNEIDLHTDPWGVMVAQADAAGKLSAKPASLHRPYPQTLVEIAAEKNSTIVFPVPIAWMKALMGAGRE
jgi:hypothetical protein